MPSSNASSPTGGRCWPRPVTRSGPHCPGGAEAVRLQPDRPQALFEGATKLFRHLQAGTDLMAAARAAGVRHVVLLSSGIIQDGADETQPSHVMHTIAERVIRDTSALWGHRHAFWAVGEGTADAHGYHGPRRLRRRSDRPIPEDDAAAVADRALPDPGHEGTVHRLTGPEPIGNARQTATIGRATGHHPGFVEAAPDRAGPELFPHLPPQRRQNLLKSFAATAGAPRRSPPPSKRSPEPRPAPSPPGPTTPRPTSGPDAGQQPPTQRPRYPNTPQNP
ncbi:FMN-dependent NADH-azoreductase [Streptomyces sp. NPDC051172]|uniref:FMN-dependent NADH-azoreductase n=1 Tax=Streptomyces sp. NPDC051172 TaxID=3155796 RepID=UPI003446AA75